MSERPEEGTGADRAVRDPDSFDGASLGAAFYRAPHGICTAWVSPPSLEVRFLAWNHRMEEITGFDLEGVNRKGGLTVLFPDPAVRQRVAARVAEVVGGADSVETEWEFTRPDGNRRRLVAWVTALKREPRGVWFMVVVQDVTSVREGQEAVARSARVNERIRSLMVTLASCQTARELMGPLLDAALDVTGMSGGGVYLVEGRNAVMHHHRGLPGSLATALAVMPLDHPGVRAVAACRSPSDIGAVAPDVAALLAAHGLHSRAFAVPLRVAGELAGFLNLASDRNPDPESIRLLGILAAEVESFFIRIRMEETLREREKFLSNVFETIQDGLSVLDRDMTVLRVNGWMDKMYAHASPLVGRKCFEVYHGRTEPCRVCPTIEAVRTGQTCTRLVPYTTDKGPVGWLDLTAFPLKDPEGRVTGVIEHVKDVTDRERSQEERRQMEEQVRHVQKLESLGVLAGGIAHDFNNLLMGILGNADLALGEMPSAAPGRSHLLEIKKASRRAADLCRQMLAYSGRSSFVVEPIDLSCLVEEMTHLLEVSVSKKALLTCRLARDLPAVVADATQLRQVVMNLITNASEAIGDRSGVISVATGVMHCDRACFRASVLDDSLPEGPYAFIEVSDTGVGMTPDVASRIFDPFFSTKFAGRGLGLSAVLGIVRGHKGAITVHSEPGRGSTFKILLPASGEPAAAHSRAGKAVAPGVRTAVSGTVLLVDDEPIIRAVAQAMLEGIGCTVLLAADGNEALQVFRSRSREIDAVVLDLTMPSMDGEECFGELRRIRGDVPVLLSSGYDEQEVVQRFAGKGLAGFIQKPYVLDELRERLLGVLRPAPDAGQP